MHEPTLLSVRHLGKHFTLHTQGGTTMPVLDEISFEVARGECLVLDGPSGAGKSTLLRCLYGNYLATTGEIWVREAGGLVRIDVAQATPQQIIELRRATISYVSQFLRVIPRVSAIDIVAEPLQALGRDVDTARDKAAALLARLNLPERLWHLPPATFSGGEQQRVNVARGFIAERPIMLLDEPTACLRGAAVVGIFHDAEVRDAVATRRLPLRPIVAEQLAA